MSPELQVDSLLSEHQGSPRILEWVAIPPPGDLPDPGIDCYSSGVSHCGGFSHRKIEALGKREWASGGMGLGFPGGSLGKDLSPVQETWV